MPEQVDVTFKLDKPPTGWQWKLYTHLDGRPELGLGLVPIEPPSEMVSVRRYDLDFVTSNAYIESASKEHNRCLGRLRAALAGKQERCGKLFHERLGADNSCNCPGATPCSMPVGHEGAHA